MVQTCKAAFFAAGNLVLVEIGFSPSSRVVSYAKTINMVNNPIRFLWVL
jgi:hypothetical protein